jgi:hypothetical protein
VLVATRLPSLNVTKEVQAATKALAPAAKRLTKSLNNLRVEDIPPGKLADFLYELVQLGKMLSKLTTPFDDILPPTKKAVEDHFINTLSVNETSGVQGTGARVQITQSEIPTPTDWPAIYKHIQKTGEFELLGRKLSTEAIRERWENKKQIPGIGVFIAKKVSCTKLSRK